MNHQTSEIQKHIMNQNNHGTHENSMQINSNKYLGTLCKRGHDYKGTKQSLKYKSNRRCVICNNETYHNKKKKIDVKRVQVERSRRENELNCNVDIGVFFLGNLCKYDHKYKNTASSLRYIACRHCVVCKKNWDVNYLNKNRKQLLLYKQTYYEERKEHFSEINKKRLLGPKRKTILAHKKRYSTSEHGKRIKRQNRLKNIDKINKQKRILYQKCKHWKGVIRWARSLPEKQCKEVMANIEALVNFKVKILNLKHLIRTGEAL